MKILHKKRKRERERGSIRIDRRSVKISVQFSGMNGKSPGSRFAKSQVPVCRWPRERIVLVTGDTRRCVRARARASSSSLRGITRAPIVLLRNYIPENCERYRLYFDASGYRLRCRKRNVIIDKQQSHFATIAKDVAEKKIETNAIFSELNLSSIYLFNGAISRR